MKRILVFLCLMACSCAPWTPRELLIIRNSKAPMYITVMPDDSTVLRTPSVDFGPAELHSEEFARLCSLMLQTLTDPSQDGVGIAAPQVGINRRLIWLKRYDKPGEPFECFANIKIDSLQGEVKLGPEGCLSVPPMRGMVPRYSSVVVSYVDPDSFERRTEQVEGYTAIIFQHECDHLDGILYIDKADTVFVSDSWAAEREGFDYSRPEWW